MRLATPFAILALVALLLSGCGGSDDGVTESITATENPTAVTRAKWEHSPDCDHPAGASRWGCSIGSYRCQAVVVDRGWSVSCSRPGRSISFTVRP
jgi:type IV pilus biogenesis protein CpaD/CtpE